MGYELVHVRIKSNSLEEQYHIAWVHNIIVPISGPGFYILQFMSQEYVNSEISIREPTEK